jgi:uncharacterized membrane protein
MPLVDGAADSQAARMLSAARRRRGTIAIVLLGLAWGTIIQALGWAQTANYALVRALSNGTAKVDAYSWESKDFAYHKGHYYSVKAPGLALVSLPIYESLNALGANELAKRMARTARRSGGPRWFIATKPNPDQYGGSERRGFAVRSKVESYTPFVWMIGLFTTVLPAALLLLLVRALAERLEPGLGTATAIVLGTGTLIMPFATLYFSHVLAAALGFACFGLLWKERERAPALTLVAIAGLLAGFAVTTEYPLAIVAAICGVYAIARERRWRSVVKRAAAYGGGALMGLVPLFVYNLLAFGTLAHNSYEGAIKEQGTSGHDVLGANAGGFFGIGVPDPGDALDLLFASKGLFVLSPVLAMGIVGTVLLFRRGRRAEALTIAAVPLAYWIYNSGYWLPFGGGSPGPRFLVPALPFLALPIVLSLRRFPATTLGLAIPSAVTMIIATATIPMIGNGDTGYWSYVIELGSFEHTIVTALGGDNGWLALSPFLALVAASVGFALAASSHVSLRRDSLIAVLSVIAWAALAKMAPLVPRIEDGGSPHNVTPLIAIGLGPALAIVALAVIAKRLPWPRRLHGAPETAG